MISTGYPWNPAIKTEVIDLVDSNVICEDLEDFPMEISTAVGANLASTPIICGGYFSNNVSVHTSDKCFKYMEGGWQHFATIIERRAHAAGIVYNSVCMYRSFFVFCKALHIFGGLNYETYTTLQSSEIVKEDGSTTEGPQLPTSIRFHAVASINSTVSVITGGRTKLWNGTDLDKTWYFNHASQEIQSGPNLLKARYGHSSGSVTDQESKEKMAIVAGGFGPWNLDSWILDSTEILLNGQWMPGKTHRVTNICLFFVYLLLL